MAAIGGISLLLSACSGAEPCRWRLELSEKVHLAAPGGSRSCNGTVEDITTELVAWYGVPPSHGSSAIDVSIQAGILHRHFSIAGNARDGSYVLPEDSGSVETSLPTGGVTGTFAFERSHDVPFVDKDDVEADEVYESVIDVDLDLVLTKFSYVDGVGVPSGCTLTTGRQRARLMQRGRITTCRTQASYRSHP